MLICECTEYNPVIKRYDWKRGKRYGIKVNRRTCGKLIKWMNEEDFKNEAKIQPKLRRQMDVLSGLGKTDR